MRPLLFLVADKNMEFALRGFFERKKWHLSIGCAWFDFVSDRDIQVASGYNDPGIYHSGLRLLKPHQRRYEHVIVMIDEEWDGSPGAELIRERVTTHICSSGWKADDGLALVLIPEVDVWLWSQTPHTAQALGWPSWDDLRSALRAEGWLDHESTKPNRPKEAAEWALRHAPKRGPRSASLYRKITRQVSATHCTDDAVQTLLERLRIWFPA